MQHSGVVASSLTSLLGLEPVAAPGARAPLEGGDGERGDGDAFAALLAAIDVSAGGEALPAGGNVLPLDAVVQSHADADAARAARPAPAPFPAPPGSREDVAAAARTLLESAASRADALSSSPAGTDPSLDPGLDGTRPGREASGGAAPSGARHVQEMAPAFSGPQPAALGDAAARPSMTAHLPVGPMPPSTVAAEAAPSQPTSVPTSPADEAARHMESRVPLDTPDGTERVDLALADAGVEPSAESGDGVRRSAARIAAVVQTAEGSSPPPAQTQPASVAAPAAAPAEPGFGIEAAPTTRGAPDAGAPARAVPDDVGESVASRIRIMVDQGTGEARLRLNPPELGTIDVRIAVVDDKTFVQLTASHAAGRDALEQSLPRLRELLTAGGLDVGGASVDGGGRGAGSGHAGSHAEASYAAVEDTGDGHGSLGSTAQRPTARSSGGVDLYA